MQRTDDANGNNTHLHAVKVHGTMALNHQKTIRCHFLTSLEMCALVTCSKTLLTEIASTILSLTTSPAHSHRRPSRAAGDY